MTSEGTWPTVAHVLAKAINPHRRPKIVFVLINLTAAVLLLASCGEQAKPAPDFQFTLYQGQEILGGEEVKFSEVIAQGRPIVLNFWAGLCPPCRAEMPDLQRFYDGSKDEFTLIGIDVGQFTGLGSKQDARNLLRELGVTYPAGFTDDGSVVSKYEVLGMPTTVFIDSQGIIVQKWTGILIREILERITQEMLE